MKQTKTFNFTRTLKLATAAGALLASSLSFASAVNIGSNDVAIHGYDPVAYFTESKPVAGKAKFTATHEGAIYRFSSAENRDLFNQDAERVADRTGRTQRGGALGIDRRFSVRIDGATFRKR